MLNTVQRRKFMLLATIMLFGTACAGNVSDPGPGNRVQLTMAGETYQSGDTVTVIVKNVSSVTLTYPYGFSGTELQREQNGTWTTVLGPTRGGPLALGVLRPGWTVSNKYPLPGDMAAGVYRLALPSPIPQGSQASEPNVMTQSFSVNSVIFNQP